MLGTRSSQVHGRMFVLFAVVVLSNMNAGEHAIHFCWSDTHSF